MTHDIYLRVAHDDVLDVYERTGDRIGQVAPSVDGWAAYIATPTGRIKTDRVGTLPTIQEAVDFVTVTTQVNHTAE